MFLECPGKCYKQMKVFEPHCGVKHSRFSKLYCYYVKSYYRMTIEANTLLSISEPGFNHVADQSVYPCAFIFSSRRWWTLSRALARSKYIVLMPTLLSVLAVAVSMKVSKFEAREYPLQNPCWEFWTGYTFSDVHKLIHYYPLSCCTNLTGQNNRMVVYDLRPYTLLEEWSYICSSPVIWDTTCVKWFVENDCKL